MPGPNDQSLSEMYEEMGEHEAAVVVGPDPD